MEESSTDQRKKAVVPRGSKAQIKRKKLDKMRKATEDGGAKREKKNEQEGLVEPKRIRREGGWWIGDECGIEEIVVVRQLPFTLSPGGYPPDGPDFDGAKMKGWEGWQRHEAFERVKDVGQTCQQMRWLLTKKPMEDGAGVRLKARLCAQGTARQDKQLAELITESPTAMRGSMRMALSVWGEKGAAIRQGQF